MYVLIVRPWTLIFLVIVILCCRSHLILYLFDLNNVSICDNTMRNENALFLLINLDKNYWAHTSTSESCVCFRTVMSTTAQLVLVIFVTVCLYVRWVYSYWKRQNVPYIKPAFPMGNKKNPLTSDTAPCEQMKTFYDHFKINGFKYGGVYYYLTPVLVWVDLDLLKSVLITDFSSFTARGLAYQETDPLSKNIFNLEGVKWKRLRTKLTPTFTSGKIKMMFKLILECSESLLQKVGEFADGRSPIDIKEILGQYTIDVIGSYAFGIKCNSFHEASMFRYYCKKTLETTPFRLLSIMAVYAFPNLATAVGLTVISKSVRKFFMKIVKDSVEYRESKGVVRNDFLQLMVELKASGNDDSLTIEEITAQCFLFFMAGYETSASATTFALYELSKNSDIQSKARNEVNEVLRRHDGNVTYEAIQEMKYLDRVMSGKFLTD